MILNLGLTIKAIFILHQHIFFKIYIIFINNIVELILDFNWENI